MTMGQCRYIEGFHGMMCEMYNPPKGLGFEVLTDEYKREFCENGTNKEGIVKGCQNFEGLEILLRLDGIQKICKQLSAKPKNVKYKTLTTFSNS